MYWCSLFSIFLLTFCANLIKLLIGRNGALECTVFFLELYTLRSARSTIAPKCAIELLSPICLNRWLKCLFHPYYFLYAIAMDRRIFHWNSLPIECTAQTAFKYWTWMRLLLNHSNLVETSEKRNEISILFSS